jgi:hypothetical protein
MALLLVKFGILFFKSCGIAILGFNETSVPRVISILHPVRCRFFTRVNDPRKLN